MLLSAICVGGFIEKGNKFLLVKESNGKYNFPMGNLEEKESLEEGCKREIKEETGYEVNIKSLKKVLHIKRDNFYLTKFLFNAEIIEGSEKSDIDDEEVLSLKWVTPEEFRDLYNKNEIRSKDMLSLLDENSLTDFYE